MTPCHACHYVSQPSRAAPAPTLDSNVLSDSSIDAFLGRAHLGFFAIHLLTTQHQLGHQQPLLAISYGHARHGELIFNLSS